MWETNEPQKMRACHFSCKRQTKPDCFDELQQPDEVLPHKKKWKTNNEGGGLDCQETDAAAANCTLSNRQLALRQTPVALAILPCRSLSKGEAAKSSTKLINGDTRASLGREPDLMTALTSWLTWQKPFDQTALNLTFEW
jgi:hypothetical protein